MSDNEVVTFDQKSYPLHTDGIWHVLMIPDQLRIPNHPNHSIPLLLSENMEACVMARGVNNHTQARVLLGEREYRLQQSDDRLRVFINEQEIKLSKQRSYQDKEEKKTIAEILIQPDGSLTLDSAKHGINILYDGKYIRLQVS